MTIVVNVKKDIISQMAIANQSQISLLSKAIAIHPVLLVNLTTHFSVILVQFHGLAQLLMEDVNVL